MQEIEMTMENCVPEITKDEFNAAIQMYELQARVARDLFDERGWASFEACCQIDDDAWNDFLNAIHAETELESVWISMALFPDGVNA